MEEILSKFRGSCPEVNCLGFSCPGVSCPWVSCPGVNETNAKCCMLWNEHFTPGYLIPLDNSTTGQLTHWTIHPRTITLRAVFPSILSRTYPLRTILPPRRANMHTDT